MNPKIQLKQSLSRLWYEIHSDDGSQKSLRNMQLDLADAQKALRELEIERCLDFSASFFRLDSAKRAAA